VASTDPSRDALILELYATGWSQRQIAERVGFTQAGISHALRRLADIPRHQTPARHDRPSGNPANATDPSKVVTCRCGHIAWKGSTTAEVYVCLVCRRQANLVICDNCDREYRRRRRNDQPGLHNYCSTDCARAGRR
jgi:hypothetical protein